MKNIKCLIVEDEPIAQQIIESFIKRLPFLELIGTASNVFEGYEVLSKNQIDLIFCDIEMPQINGLEFLKSLPNRPQVIMTTAFHQFAHEGFELDVADYLLKPIAFERFLRAVQKVKEKLEVKEVINNSKNIQQIVQAPLPIVDGHIFVKEDGNLIKVAFNEIQYIEAMKDYVKIYIENRFIVTYLTMKKMEEVLPDTLFGRIHKSYITNLTKIVGINGNMITLNSKIQIPIGMLFRESLLSKINNQVVIR